MANTTTPSKKRLVISYHSLAPEQQTELKSLYPHGFTEHLMRVSKPDGTFFCAVQYETPEANYLVKIDVKIDNRAAAEEDDEKEYYDDELKEDDHPSTSPRDEDEDDE